MRKRDKITAIAAISICSLLPITPTEIGFSAISPWWTHLTYPFFHTGIIHLAFNAYSLYVLLSNNVFHVHILFPLIYGIAVLSSFLSAMEIPTVGASGIVFAMAGIRMYGVRSYKAWITLAIPLIGGFLLPNVNAVIHIWAFSFGMLAAWVHLKLNHLRNDNLAVSRRERKA